MSCSSKLTGFTYRVISWQVWCDFAQNSIILPLFYVGAFTTPVWPTADPGIGLKQHYNYLYSE